METRKIIVYFALALKEHLQGTLAEWLGIGLQNRVRRFESARYLEETKLKNLVSFILKSLKNPPDIQKIDHLHNEKNSISTYNKLYNQNFIRRRTSFLYHIFLSFGVHSK